MIYCVQCRKFENPSRFESSKAYRTSIPFKSYKKIYRFRILVVSTYSLFWNYSRLSEEIKLEFEYSFIWLYINSFEF